MATEGDLPNWIVALGTSLVAGFGGFVVAMVNRGPALQSAVDARLRTLIDGYERRIDDLMTEVHALRSEVVSLRQALDAAKAPPPHFGL